MSDRSKSFNEAMLPALSYTPSSSTSIKSLASNFPSASQSFFLIASHPAFSLAMISASEGAAVDFISPPLFAFDMVSLFPRRLRGAGSHSHEKTHKRKNLLHKNSLSWQFGKTRGCFYNKTAGRVKDIDNKGRGSYQSVAKFSAFSVVPVFGPQSAGLKATRYAILAVFKTVRVNQSAGRGAKHHEKAFCNRARFYVCACGKRVDRGAQGCGAGKSEHASQIFGIGHNLSSPASSSPPF